MHGAEELTKIIRQFDLDLRGRPQIRPLGAGRIHASWTVAGAPGGGGHHGREPVAVLQRINTGVFDDPDRLMSNFRRVCEGLGEQCKLPPFEARSGGFVVRDAAGGSYRLLRYVPGSRPVETAPSAEEAFEAARAFGIFLATLAPVPSADWYIPLPGFHDTPARLAELRAACPDPLPPLASELLGRESRAAFVTTSLAAGELPTRLCHNDAKADNVLLDADSGNWKAVVDLDTVMPGSAIHDIGDLLRTAAAARPEDHPEPDEQAVRWDCARAIVEGYRAGAGGVLTDREAELLSAAGWLLAVEQAARFLTDHFSGDRYYAVQYAGQNLVRARVQFALVREFERAGWAPPGVTGRPAPRRP
jgi:N-acetylhexosamine 1-kinase